MTFSCDLWVIQNIKLIYNKYTILLFAFQNGFDFVYSHFNERRQGLKQLLYIFSEKYDYENELAKGIKRLHDFNFSITNEGTLATGISVFRNELLTEYNHKVEYLNDLKDKLIEPLRVFLETQITNGRKYHIEIKELERDFKSVCDHLDKSKMLYHSCARVAEDAKLQSEMARNNQNLSNDHKNKFLNKVQQCLKEAKEAEKVYIDNINLSNSSRERYTEVAKNILDEFQLMEEKYIEQTKEFLRKFFELQFIFIKNMSAGYEKKIKTIEVINTTTDIKEFIEKNATNLLPPYKFEFIPYTSDVQTKYYEQTSYPIEVIDKVKNFISKAFVSELPELEPDPQEAKHNLEIQGIINSAWEGRLNEEDKKNVSNWLKYII